MKRLINKLLLTSTILLSLFFTSCGEKKADTEAGITPKSLPASGAKTYITSQAGLISFAQNIDSEINITAFTEELSNLYNIDEISESLESVLENSSYIDALKTVGTNIANSVEENVDSFKKSGTIDLDISEKPGKATDLPPGLNLDIPEITVKVAGSIDDINNPSKVNYELNAKTGVKVQVKDCILEIPEVSIQGKLNGDLNLAEEKVNGTASLGEKFSIKYEMPGLKYNLSNADNNLDVSANVDGDRITGKGTLSSTFALDYEFDAKKAKLESSAIKYLKSNSSVSGTLSAAPNYNGKLRGKVNYDYIIKTNTGIVFAGISGTGGKAIIKSDIGLKGTVSLTDFERFIEDFVDKLSELIDGNKLTEEEFKEVEVPFNVVLSATFYDDSNNPTYELANFKNNYEFYSYMYDLAKASGMSSYEIIEQLYSLVEEVYKVVLDQFLKYL